MERKQRRCSSMVCTCHSAPLAAGTPPRKRGLLGVVPRVLLPGPGLCLVYCVVIPRSRSESRDSRLGTDVHVLHRRRARQRERADRRTLAPTASYVQGARCEVRGAQTCRRLGAQDGFGGHHRASSRWLLAEAEAGSRLDRWWTCSRLQAPASSVPIMDMFHLHLHLHRQLRRRSRSPRLLPAWPAGYLLVTTQSVSRAWPVVTEK